MEKPYCVQLDMDSSIKQEFIQEDDLLDKRILTKQESQCEQLLDKSDALLIKNEIEVEDISEETNIQSIIKEELIIENEDIHEQHTSPNGGTVANEDVIQQVISNRTRESETHKVGLSETKFGSQKHQCEVCNTAFTRLSSLSRHVSVHRGTKKFECDICKKLFTQKCSVSRHKLIHNCVKEYECDVCNEAFTELHDLSVHKLIHNCTMNYMCEVCSETFARLGSLSRHKLIHCGVKYACYICKKSFTRKNEMTRHMLLHSGIKEYKCDVCNRAFCRLNNLTVHKKIIHNSTKKYKCEVCNKAITRLSDLSRHRLIHSGVKQYA